MKYGNCPKELRKNYGFTGRCPKIPPHSKYALMCCYCHLWNELLLIECKSIAHYIVLNLAIFLKIWKDKLSLAGWPVIRLPVTNGLLPIWTGQRANGFNGQLTHIDSMAKRKRTPKKKSRKNLKRKPHYWVPKMNDVNSVAKRYAYVHVLIWRWRFAEILNVKQ